VDRAVTLKTTILHDQDGNVAYNSSEPGFTHYQEFDVENALLSASYGPAVKVLQAEAGKPKAVSWFGTTFDSSRYQMTTYPAPSGGSPKKGILVDLL
jgi:hypothetical protein